MNRRFQTVVPRRESVMRRASSKTERSGEDKPSGGCSWTTSNIGVLLGRQFAGLGLSRFRASPWQGASAWALRAEPARKVLKNLLRRKLPAPDGAISRGFAQKLGVAALRHCSAA